MSRRPARRRPGLLLVALPLACSTLADRPAPESCATDKDCVGNEICGAGVCYASNLPPRTEVALDMPVAGIDAGFRLEILGTDKSVKRLDSRPTRYQVRLDNDGELSGVRDQLELRVEENYRFNDEPIPLAAGLGLSQLSRLATSPTAANVRFDITDAMGVALDPIPPIVLPWAHYWHDDDPPFGPGTAGDGPSRPLLVQLSPEDTPDPISMSDVQRGLVYRQLVREQEEVADVHAFTLHTDRDCHRKLHGAVIVGDGATAPVGVTVDLLHAGRDPDDGPVCDPTPETGTPAVCSPSTVERAGPYTAVPCTSAELCPPGLGCYPSGDDDGGKTCQCAKDRECATGQVCDLASGQCVLDLAGLVATEGGTGTGTVANPDLAEFEAWIYTYCEEDPEGDREMEFVVRATPVTPEGASASPLPPLSFHTALDFSWQMGERPRAELKTICFPGWAPPQPIDFAFTSAPQELLRGPADESFVCCTPDCLEIRADGVAPPAPASCPLGATVTARTIFTPDPALWAKYSCMELDQPDPTVPAGSQRISYPFDRTKCEPGACQIFLSPGTSGLDYEIRVEPPVGSLVRSMVLPAAQRVEPGVTGLTAPDELEYRVLLRGNVDAEEGVCPETTATPPTKDCVKADILAERLRVPGEEPALLPVFYTGATIPGSNGAFVLPVNPGVYLVTALPASGSPGGPADIRVVDLRLTSKLVDASRPIPVADLAEPFVLNAGRLVTFELDGFGSISQAAPLDVGYWTADRASLVLPGSDVPLDLNDPDTCYGGQSRGCAIRRLRLAGRFLSLTQEGYVKYLARGATQAESEEESQ